MGDRIAVRARRSAAAEITGRTMSNAARCSSQPRRRRLDQVGPQVEEPLPQRAARWSLPTQLDAPRMHLITPLVGETSGEPQYGPGNYDRRPASFPPVAEVGWERRRRPVPIIARGKMGMWMGQWATEAGNVLKSFNRRLIGGGR